MMSAETITADRQQGRCPHEVTAQQKDIKGCTCYTGPQARQKALSGNSDIYDWLMTLELNPYLL